MRWTLLLAVAGLFACGGGDDASGDPGPPPNPGDPALWCTVAVTEGAGDALLREASLDCPTKLNVHVAPSAGAGGWILVDAGYAQRIYEVLPGASREIAMPVHDGTFHQLCSEGDGALHVFSH